MANDQFPNRSPAVPGRLLLNEREGAAVMGCSTKTLFNMRTNDQLPYVKLGNRTMYDPADLQRWIDSRKTTVKPQAAEAGK